MKCDFYAEWLAQEIGIYNLQELHNILRHKDTKSILGRPCSITVETKLKVQDYWKANSVISVDRRNQRNNIRVAKKSVSKIACDVLDKDGRVTLVETKCGWKFQSDKYIYTKPV